MRIPLSWLTLAALIVLTCVPAGCSGQTAGGTRPADDQIRAAILRHVILEFAKDGGYVAPYQNVYLISAPPPVVATLVEDCRRHTPPVKPVDERLPYGDAVIHAPTGKKGMILSVPFVRRRGGEAEASGSWYAAPLTAMFYAYSLRRENGRWVVVSRTVAGVS